MEQLAGCAHNVLAASIASQSLEADFLSVGVTNGEVVPVVPDEPDVRLTGRRGRRNPPVATVVWTRKASSPRVAGA